MTECSVEGCSRPSRGKGLCSAHYFRQYRTGDVGEAKVWDRQRPPCSVAGCERPGQRSGMCAHHRRRVQRNGDPHHDARQDQPTAGASPSWVGDAAAYSTVHKRLYRERGRADQHQCEHCTAPATQWAYDHQAPDERHDPEGRPYTTDLAHYMPLCFSCHVAFDQRREVRVA